MNTPEINNRPPTRIISISVTTDTEDYCSVVFALCEDGSIWFKVRREGEDWVQFSDPFFEKP